MHFLRLKFICTEEKVECNDESLNTLVETSGGDMRRAITCLQSCAKLTGQYSPIKIDHVYEVTGVSLFFNIVIIINIWDKIV